MPTQQPRGKPWSQGPAAAAQGNRKLVFTGRVAGTVQEWNKQWGWIVPTQKISHPQFRGKLYVHSKDVQTATGSLEVGETISFLLYSDSRGLGAGDIREAGASGEASHGLADAGAEDEKLPEGWEKLFSEEHGEYYYWNAAVKEASWVPPPAEEEDEDLPEGWTKQFDAEQNHEYYWHAKSKTTSWDRPKPEKPADEGATGEQEAQEAEPEVRPAADGPVLGQQRVKGRVDKWQGFFGWITPTQEVSDELKPLLEGRQDKVYCNWRDVREGTTMKAGMLVDFLVFVDDNGLAASDVKVQGKDEPKAPAPEPRGRGKKRPARDRDVVAELAQMWEQQDAEMAEHDPEAAEAAAAAAPAGMGVADVVDTESPLLPGWEQHWSDEHSCHYYWHVSAKMASWDRPCVPVDPKDVKPDKVWEGEGAEEGASRMATPITPVASWAGKEITPLTPATAADKEAAKLATKGMNFGGQAAGEEKKPLQFQSMKGKAASKGKTQKAPAGGNQNKRVAPTQAAGKGKGKGGATSWSQGPAKRQR